MATAVMINHQVYLPSILVDQKFTLSSESALNVILRVEAYGGVVAVRHDGLDTAPGLIIVGGRAASSGARGRGI